jgi:hypothetical protein
LSQELLSTAAARLDTKPTGPGIDKINFTGLHNVAKHCTYLVEATEAMKHTMDSMITAHTNHTAQACSSTTTLQATFSGRGPAHSALVHRLSLFQSMKLRVTSLDRRIQNGIGLVRQTLSH